MERSHYTEEEGCGGEGEKGKEEMFIWRQKSTEEWRKREECEVGRREVYLESQICGTQTVQEEKREKNMGKQREGKKGETLICTREF